MNAACIQGGKGNQLVQCQLEEEHPAKLDETI